MSPEYRTVNAVSCESCRSWKQDGHTCCTPIGGECRNPDSEFFGKWPEWQWHGGYPACSKYDRSGMVTIDSSSSQPYPIAAW